MAELRVHHIKTVLGIQVEQIGLDIRDVPKTRGGRFIPSDNQLLAVEIHAGDMTSLAHLSREGDGDVSSAAPYVDASLTGAHPRDVKEGYRRPVKDLGQYAKPVSPRLASDMDAMALFHVCRSFFQYVGIKTSGYRGHPDKDTIAFRMRLSLKEVSFTACFPQ